MSVTPDVQSPGVIRTELTMSYDDDISRDYFTNTVHHHVGWSGVQVQTDYDNHAQEVLDAFSGHSAGYEGFTQYSGINISAKVIDLGDPGSIDAPRQVRSVKSYSPSGGALQRASGGPGQLAAVLSYYAGGNVAGQRGRIYLGAFAHGAPAGPVITPTTTAMLVILGHALFDIGGENVAHVIYHPRLTKSGHAAGSYSVVQHYYVANDWAVIRRRAIRSTGRTTVNP
jgi:hypothetical protein